MSAVLTRPAGKLVATAVRWTAELSQSARRRKFRIAGRSRRAEAVEIWCAARIYLWLRPETKPANMLRRKCRSDFDQRSSLFFVIVFLFIYEA